MLYKPINWIIRKEDFKKSDIILKNFTLLPENISILFGNVKIENNMPAIGVGVVLEEIDKTTKTKTDKCFTFTNEYGYYYLAFNPIDNKTYSIVIYRNFNSK